MAIYREGGKGSLVIDRRIQGQRFKVATGLPDTAKGRDLAKLWDGMVTVLAREAGRGDVVRAIQSGTLRFAEVWAHYRVGRLDRLPSPEAMRRLFPVDGPKPGAVGDWLKTYRTKKGTLSPSHKRSLRQKFTDLERLDPSATVADLPRLVKERMAVCGAREQGRTGNLTKAAAQAFLRSTLGRHQSTLWAEVADIPLLPTEKHEPHPQTPEDAKAVREALGAIHGPIWWAMCTTGMMPDELWGGKFTVLADRIHIKGTKRAGRDRLVPKLSVPLAPERGYKSFRLALKRASGGVLTPYDARHTYAHWLEMAGLESSEQDALMGHGPKTMGDLYRQHDVSAKLAQFRDRLLNYLGEPQGAALRLA